MNEISSSSAPGLRPRRFSVTGMHCSACSMRVERAVSKTPGVTSCAVSLLTNEMSVTGTASDDEIVAAVVKAGFGAAPARECAKKRETDIRQTASGAQPPDDSAIRRPDGPSALRARLIASLVLLAILMYATMGHMMLGWPLPRWFTEPEPNHVAMGLAQLLLSGAVLVLNRRFFTSGFRAVLRGAPDMDTLVALGAGAAYAWSVAVLFLMTRAQVLEGTAGAEAWMGQYYFESAAMIVTLITVGKLLEERAKGKTTSALAALLRLAPRTATVVRDGREAGIPVSQVRVGDIFLVRPGENIPVDGVVDEGESAVNESALTGESIPVDKAPGAAVSAATSNVSGFLRCRATRVGEDTTLAQIVRLMRDAAATKAPIARLADRVAAVFVPAVLLVALVTLGVWLACGAEPGFALARAISVLVVSCPCALGLATPVAIMVGSGVGARRGILFKTAASLEAAGRTQIVVLDKTGTVTTGKPRVIRVLFPFTEAARVALLGAHKLGKTENEAARPFENEVLRVAAAIERGSEHPLAKAIVEEAAARKIDIPAATGLKSLAGVGMEGVVDGEPVFIGKSEEAVRRIANYDDELDSGSSHILAGEEFAHWSEDVKSASHVEIIRGGKCVGSVFLADVPKPDSLAAVRALRQMGMRVLLLTGDNKETAENSAFATGIDEVIADVLPDGKHRVIEDLKKQGRVAMVGDGINDAPALAAADLGLAIGAGTDVAIDAADAVLVHSRLSDVPAALRLGRATLRNIRENLFWAFFYNVLLIPLAAGLWYPLFGWKMHPDLGALAMSLSSFCVVMNALRLNLTKN